MILSHFYITSRDGTIYQNFEEGYKSSDFLEKIASSWKFDSTSNSLMFVINVVNGDDETMSASVSNEDGLLTIIHSKSALEFRVGGKCLSIICGYNEVHMYSYV
jgi:hypothetical protein